MGTIPKQSSPPENVRLSPLSRSLIPSTWRQKLERQKILFFESELVQDLPVEVEELLKEVTTGLANQINAMAVRLNTMAAQTVERRVSDVMASVRETKEQAEAELANAAATVEDLERQLDSVKDIRESQGGNWYQLTIGRTRTGAGSVSWNGK